MICHWLLFITDYDSASHGGGRGIAFKLRLLLSEVLGLAYSTGVELKSKYHVSLFLPNSRDCHVP